MEGREHVIVCGVDGSVGSQRALEWAVDESARRDCKLRVVTAWSWDGVEAFGAASSPAAALSRGREIQEDAVSRALAATRHSPQMERVMTRGVPSRALCAAALDAELVVLGSQGHGFVHDRLVGSTSQHVVRHASCPVVLVPDPRHVEREVKRGMGKRHGEDAPTGSPMY